jgi:hypothetical protein
MADTVASGVFSYSNTLTASTAFDFTSPDFWNYIAVTNLGATAPIYATADGSTASASNGVAIAAGETGLLANQLGYWNQSSNALVAGSIQVGDGAAYNASTNPSRPSNPGSVTPMESLRGNIPAGSFPNPGTSVSLYSAAANAYTISAAG